MTQNTIQLARALYNIPQWSEGYFDINDQGHVVAIPQLGGSSVDLQKLYEEVQAAGIPLPLLIRFPDILKHRMYALSNAFQQAMNKYEYKAEYLPVYPIKVNQQHVVLDTLLNVPDMGLETGSKPELLAVMGLKETSQHSIICNGYKDREYIRLALIAQMLGHRVFIIIEKLSELQLIAEESLSLKIKPLLGLRLRLSSLGKGKWQNTGGEKAKFGLTAAQVLHALQQLQSINLISQLQLIHCHMGSQIANIHDIRGGMDEVAQYYRQFQQQGANIQWVDVGGGLGVDYQGTASRHDCSTNYKLQEYADNIVQGLSALCKRHELPCPNIITESGRAIAAHHAVLLTNVVDAERPIIEAHDDCHGDGAIADLQACVANVSKRSPCELYHEAGYHLTKAQEQFKLGLLDLQGRAIAENLYANLCDALKEVLQEDIQSHREISSDIQEKLATKLYCNFSLFQSLPDIWAIQQVFPILPLRGLNEVCSEHVILHDITCDSDGRIDDYVSEKAMAKTLLLPKWLEDEPPVLGIFLVGAYQEILGDMHNLFGDTHSINVLLQTDGSYQLSDKLEGDSVQEVLDYVHIDAAGLAQNYKEKIRQKSLPQELSDYIQKALELGLKAYTYLD